MLANRLPRIAVARITPPSYSGSPGNAGLSCFGGGCDEFSARAIYYTRDRMTFFRQVVAFTEKKLVFDLNPRRYRVDDVVADLRAAGFGRIELRPFFVPQTVALPRPAVAVARALERSGPLAARLALHFRFTYLVAASCQNGE